MRMTVSGDPTNDIYEMTLEVDEARMVFATQVAGLTEVHRQLGEILNRIRKDMKEIADARPEPDSDGASEELQGSEETGWECWPSS